MSTAVLQSHTARTFSRRHFELGRPARDISRLADRANQELAARGHAGHELTLERVSRLPAEPSSLGCLFWCEICHVSQLLVLPEPGVR